MDNENILIALDYAVESVPIFDGTNIPVEYFIEACEEAKYILPSELELQFIKIIRIKFVGEARSIIRDQEFYSITQLIKYLKQIYGLSKDFFQLQSELGCLYQSNEENIVAYINRVKSLKQQILEAYEDSQNKLYNQNFKALLEKDIIKYFIRGLKPEIEQRISKHLDFQETTIEALRIEKDLHVMADLRREQNSYLYPNRKQIYKKCLEKDNLINNCKTLNLNSQQIYNKIHMQFEGSVYQGCKNSGHNTEKCQFTNTPENLITCQLCKKSGHSAIKCRLNNNSNPMYNYIICQWCDTPGHLATNCWKKQAEEHNAEVGQLICQICNKYGHTARNCRIDQNQFRNNPFCRYCKEIGHLIKDCQSRIANNNRKIINKSENSNEMTNMLNSSSAVDISDMRKDKPISNSYFVTIKSDKHNRAPTKTERIDKEIINPEISILKKSEIRKNFASNDTSIKSSNILLNLRVGNDKYEINPDDIKINENIERKNKTIKRKSEAKAKNGIKKRNFMTYKENDYRITPEMTNNFKTPEEETHQTSSSIKNNYRIQERLSYQNLPKILAEKETPSTKISESDFRTLERSSQISPKNPLTLPGGASYQTPLEILGERSIQISPESFESVDCEEESNQTSLRNSTSFSKNLKERSKSSLENIKRKSESSEKIKFPKFGANIKRSKGKITISKKISKEGANYKDKNKLLEILKSLRIKSQTMIDKFMRKRKSIHKSKSAEKSQEEIKKYTQERPTLQEESANLTYSSLKNFNVSSINPNNLSTNPIKSKEMKCEIISNLSLSNSSNLENDSSTYVLLEELKGKREIKYGNLNANLPDTENYEDPTSKNKHLNKEDINVTLEPHSSLLKTPFNKMLLTHGACNQTQIQDQVETPTHSEETKDDAGGTKRRTDPPDKFTRQIRCIGAR